MNLQLKRSISHKPLNNNTLLKAIGDLAKTDDDLKNIIQKFGAPPLWDREEGFPTLIRIILEQQVSLKSAKAAYEKLVAKASPLTPQKLLKLSDSQLKAFGFSRQKINYCRNVANVILDGTLDLNALLKMDNDTVKSELMKIKGVGQWTSDIYLLMALKRPDVWPNGDLALATAIQKIKNLENRPTDDEMKEISENWKPWRAVAARILWHYYLNNGNTE
jgi:DNA-3-methyladenine glycosylase II